MDSRKGAASGFSGGKHAAGDKEGSVPSRWKGRNGENASYAAVRLSEGAWWLKQDKQPQQGSRPTHMQHSRQQSRSRKTTLSEQATKNARLVGIGDARALHAVGSRGSSCPCATGDTRLQGLHCPGRSVVKGLLRYLE